MALSQKMNQWATNRCDFDDLDICDLANGFQLAFLNLGFTIPIIKFNRFF